MLTRRSAIAGILALPLTPARLAENTLPWQTRLIRAARNQIGVTNSYDPAYVGLTYPNGDIPRDRGVCTDVVIRAYRDAFEVDLQQLVHEDMRGAFSDYPANWGLTRPDRNIDHRRVPNLERYFERNAKAFGAPVTVSDWQPGDLYTMRLSNNLPHIGIVSDKTTASGRPYILHNIGWGTAEDDIIGQFGREQRFRFQPDGTV